MKHAVHVKILLFVVTKYWIQFIDQSVQFNCTNIKLLSFSQVACERSFSTLKVIKNRIRTLSSKNLNCFMTIVVEKGLLMNLDSDDIIDEMAKSSELLRKSLNIKILKY